jgi:hypothetical protein
VIEVTEVRNFPDIVNIVVVSEYPKGGREPSMTDVCEGDTENE